MAEHVTRQLGSQAEGKAGLPPWPATVACHRGLLPSHENLALANYACYLAAIL